MQAYGNIQSRLESESPELEFLNKMSHLDFFNHGIWRQGEFTDLFFLTK